MTFLEALISLAKSDASSGTTPLTSTTTSLTQEEANTYDANYGS